MAHDAGASQKARDFMVLPREAFAARYEDAARIASAEDQLRQAVTDAQPIRPAVEKLLNQELRRSIANTLLRGQLPNVTPATLAQVRFQTAYASLEHIAGLRALGREPHLNLTDAHRSLLIEAARTQNSGGQVAKIPLSPMRASEIAMQLAAVDPAGAQNPFSEGPLKRDYEQHRKSAPSAPTHSNERSR